MESFYNILGVNENATTVDIKAAYRKLSLAYHPDRPGGDAEKFKKISSAYETLSDDLKRRQYDHQYLRGGGVGGGGGGGGGGGVDDNEMDDINNLFNMMFNGVGVGMGRMPFGMGGGGGGNVRIFHNGVEVDSANGSPFGGSGGGGGGGSVGGANIFNPMEFMGHQMFRNMQKPPIIIKTVKITLEAAFSGILYPLEIERWIAEDNTKTSETETIYINIPAGIDDNEIIMLKGKGHVLNEDNMGDIKIILQIDNTTVFRRVGLDLIFKKTITLKDALCGFSFDLTHLNGNTLCLNNKTNKTIIKPNYTKVIPGMGMVREERRGNLIIEFDIVFPDSLSAEQIEKIEEIL